MLWKEQVEEKVLRRDHYSKTCRIRLRGDAYNRVLGHWRVVTWIPPSTMIASDTSVVQKIELVQMTTWPGQRSTQWSRGISAYDLIELPITTRRLSIIVCSTSMSHRSTIPLNTSNIFHSIVPVVSPCTTSQSPYFLPLFTAWMGTGN